MSAAENTETKLVDRLLDEFIRAGQQAAVIKEREHQTKARLDKIEAINRQLQEKMSEVEGLSRENRGRLEQLAKTINKPTMKNQVSVDHSNRSDHSTRTNNSKSNNLLIGLFVLGVIVVLVGAYLSFDGKSLNLGPSKPAPVTTK